MKKLIWVGIVIPLLLTGCGLKDIAIQNAIEATQDEIGKIQTAIAETQAAKTTPSHVVTLAPTPTDTSNLIPTETTKLVSENDLAVCDAYQDLVNAWPADSPAVKAAGSAQDIYLAIEETGAALAAAGRSADSSELGEAGVAVGNAAVKDIEMDETAREIGFVPYFDESRIGGKLLSNLCSELGKPISYP